MGPLQWSYLYTATMTHVGDNWAKMVWLVDLWQKRHLLYFFHIARHDEKLKGGTDYNSNYYWKKKFNGERCWKVLTAATLWLWSSSVRLSDKQNGWRIVVSWLKSFKMRSSTTLWRGDIMFDAIFSHWETPNSHLLEAGFHTERAVCYVQKSHSLNRE